MTFGDVNTVLLIVLLIVLLKPAQKEAVLAPAEHPHIRGQIEGGRSDIKK